MLDADNEITYKFYDKYKDRFIENLDSEFNNIEKQRKRENLLYKIKSFLLFVIIPLVIFLAIWYSFSTKDFGLFIFIILVLLFFPLFLKKMELKLIPGLLVLLLLFPIFLVQYINLFIAFSIGLYLFIYISCFIDYRAKCNRIFMNSIKKQYMYKILELMGNLKWIGNNYYKDTAFTRSSVIPDYEINKSSLFVPYNKRYIDDEFEDNYKGVPFYISETKLCMESHDSKFRNAEAAYFQGVIIKFKTNKPTKAKTIVSTKQNLTQVKYVKYVLFISSLLGLFFLYQSWYSPYNRPIFFVIFIIILPIIILSLIAYIKIKREFEKITLEDTKFIKKFNVSSSDQVEARYLLTTAFMERLKNLKTSFGAKVVKCSFYEDNLMIAITTNKNLFEIGSLFESFKDTKIIKRFLNELESIYKMIDYFKLDEKTKL